MAPRSETSAKSAQSGFVGCLMRQLSRMSEELLPLNGQFAQKRHISLVKQAMNRSGAISATLGFRKLG